jgi:hypothetical protein
MASQVMTSQAVRLESDGMLTTCTPMGISSPNMSKITSIQEDITTQADTQADHTMARHKQGGRRGPRTGRGNNLLRVTSDSWLATDVRIRLVQQVGGIGACLGQDPPGKPIGLLQQRFEQVLRLHYLLACLLADRQPISGLQVEQ